MVSALFPTDGGLPAVSEKKGDGAGVSPRDHYAKGEKRKAGSVSETCRQWWGRVPESQALLAGLGSWWLFFLPLGAGAVGVCRFIR